MNRIVIIAALAITVPFAVANAAGPFDGTYAGGSPAMGRMGCSATTATVTITDGKISGKYEISKYTYSISGTVAADGTVTGKWAAYPLTGKISGGHFAGSYTSKECNGARPVELNKTG
jgi:hypothetical protein